jgi:hypothetical protein
VGLINWIFDIYQHGKIDDAHREAAQARAELASMSRRGREIDAKRLQEAFDYIEELALATRALRRTLVEKGVCTTEELERIVREVDLEGDGVYVRRRLP